MMLSKLRHLLAPPTRRPFRLIQVEPALECNLACVMCPWVEMRPGKAVMHWDTFERVAPAFRLAQEVDFTGGGEPTVNPRLTDMILVAKELGCRTGFSTNGTLLDRSLALELIGIDLDWISFSVDGANAATYEAIRERASFELVARNIETLRDARADRHRALPRVIMVFVMMQENVHELPAFVDLAHRWGAQQVIAKNLDVILKEGDDERRVFRHVGGDGLQVHPVHRREDGGINSGVNAVRSDDVGPVALERTIAEAQRRAARHGLGLRVYSFQPAELAVCEPDPLHAMFVNWEGNVSPCITLAYASERVFAGRRHSVPCVSFGNLQDEDVLAIWEKPEYRQFRSAWEARLAWEQEKVVAAVTGSLEEELSDLPPAPAGCHACYYLYGI